jgi:tRNA-splicing ligase RtcB
MAELPFTYRWIAVMPDAYQGKGATVGSVVATAGAIVPAAVGVDIGCGMMAARTTLGAAQLPGDLRSLREAIEAAVPHGRSHNGGPSDRGAWSEPPAACHSAWRQLAERYQRIVADHSRIGRGPDVTHLGTLGTGNHFIELCLDEEERVWLLLHSGSRGLGNRIGSYFIELAKQDMRRWFINLPDEDLAYLPEGSEHFGEHMAAVGFSQDYARRNRELMMQAVVGALGRLAQLPPFEASVEVVNCHHNYVEREHHFGSNVLVTRKGAVRARRGELGIIPGSMGRAPTLCAGSETPTASRAAAMAPAE